MEKGLFPPFSGFPKCSSDPPQKGKKGRKRGETLLKPPFVAPPFVPAQDQDRHFRAENRHLTEESEYAVNNSIWPNSGE